VIAEIAAKKLRQLERRFIPRIRHTDLYSVFRLGLLAPVYLLLLVELAISRIKALLTSSKSTSLKLLNIVDGWANLAAVDPKVEILAHKRASICAQCPAAVASGALYTVVVDNRTKQIRGMSCQDCGCPLSAKVRSVNDSCPRGKW